MSLYEQYEPEFEQNAKMGCLKWVLVIGTIIFIGVIMKGAICEELGCCL